MSHFFNIGLTGFSMLCRQKFNIIFYNILPFTRHASLHMNVVYHQEKFGGHTVGSK